MLAGRWPVGRSAEPSRYALELDRAVRRSDHVHHQPRSVARRGTFRCRVDVEGVDRLLRDRQQLAHDRTVAARTGSRCPDRRPDSPRSVGDWWMESGDPPTYFGSVDGSEPFQHKSTIRPLFVHMTAVVIFSRRVGWVAGWWWRYPSHSSRSRCPWGPARSGDQK